MVFSIIGWALLGILALILLVLLAPAAASVRFEHGQLSVKVRVLFIQKTIFPQDENKKVKPKKEKKKKKKKDKPEEEQAKEPKEEKKKKTVSDYIALAKRLLASGKDALKPVLHNLRIIDTRLVLPVHAEEAADTALKFGRAQTAIGTARALLDGRLDVRFKQLEVIPDFTGQRQDELFFACKIVLNPVIMVVAGFKFLKTYIMRGKKRRKYSRAQMQRMLAQKQAASAAAAGK